MPRVASVDGGYGPGARPEWSCGVVSLAVRETIDVLPSGPVGPCPDEPRWCPRGGTTLAAGTAGDRVAARTHYF